MSLSFPIRSVLARNRPGFTIIEMLIVVAIFAILALLAAPGVQEAALRRQVKEGLALADVAKAGVQTIWSLTNEMPRDNDAAGVPERHKIVGNLVSAVSVEYGAVTVVLRADSRWGVLLRKMGLAD